MSSIDNVWASTTADGDFGEDNAPPAGHMGVARVSGTRTGTSKKGEQYFAIDLKDDQGGYSWGIYKEFTKNGQAVEGRVKSAKITLRQVGIDVASPSLLPQMLKGIEGRHYCYEQTASSTLNTVTGMPYVNSNITGQASAPAGPPQAAPAPVVQAPVQFAQPPATIPGQTLDQALTQPQPAGAQFGDDIPWDQPTGVQPSPVQQGTQG